VTDSLQREAMSMNMQKHKTPPGGSVKRDAAPA
jgi:hypothetical protein